MDISDRHTISTSSSKKIARITEWIACGVLVLFIALFVTSMAWYRPRITYASPVISRMENSRDNFGPDYLVKTLDIWFGLDRTTTLLDTDQVIVRIKSVGIREDAGMTILSIRLTSITNHGSQLTLNLLPLKTGDWSSAASVLAIEGVPTDWMMAGRGIGLSDPNSRLSCAKRNETGMCVEVVPTPWGSLAVSWADGKVFGLPLLNDIPLPADGSIRPVFRTNVPDIIQLAPGETRTFWPPGDTLDFYVPPTPFPIPNGEANLVDSGYPYVISDLFLFSAGWTMAVHVPLG